MLLLSTSFLSIPQLSVMNLMFLCVHKADVGAATPPLRFSTTSVAVPHRKRRSATENPETSCFRVCGQTAKKDVLRGLGDPGNLIRPRFARPPSPSGEGFRIYSLRYGIQQISHPPPDARRRPQKYICDDNEYGQAESHDGNSVKDLLTHISFTL